MSLIAKLGIGCMEFRHSFLSNCLSMLQANFTQTLAIIKILRNEVFTSQI